MNSRVRGLPCTLWFINKYIVKTKTIETILEHHN